MIAKELGEIFGKMANYQKSVADWAFVYFLDGDKTFDECMEIGRKIMRGEDPE